MFDASFWALISTVSILIIGKTRNKMNFEQMKYHFRTEYSTHTQLKFYFLHCFDCGCVISTEKNEIISSELVSLKYSPNSSNNNRMNFSPFQIRFNFTRSLFSPNKWPTWVGIQLNTNNTQNMRKKESLLPNEMTNYSWYLSIKKIERNLTVENICDADFVSSLNF